MIQGPCRRRLQSNSDLMLQGGFPKGRIFRSSEKLRAEKKIRRNISFSRFRFVISFQQLSHMVIFHPSDGHIFEKNNSENSVSTQTHNTIFGNRTKIVEFETQGQKCDFLET